MADDLQGTEAAPWSSQGTPTPQGEGQAAGQPQHGSGRGESPKAVIKWILDLGREPMWGWSEALSALSHPKNLCFSQKPSIH